ncbi:MAG: RNaseH domain-containing protein, partial [Rivularia sp. (in: cyanobacteria)]
DEYYPIHDEGYKYLNEETQRNRGHSIKTGFSFAERGDITSKVLDLLNNTLIPDTPLETDIPTPKGQKKPLAMCNYKDIFKSTKKLEIRQKTIYDAIQRALKHKPMHIFLICKERDTHELTYQQLRDSFILEDGEDFPSYIKVSQIWIDDFTLLQPLDTEGLKPKDGDKFKKQIKKQHQKKRDAWSNFLQTKVLKLINDDVDSGYFAIVEIGQTKRKGILPQQNIKGAIREACIKNNIHSQIVQTVRKRVKKKEDEEDYTTAEKAIILNSVLDLILRQTATLYGLPLQIYEQARIPQSIAKELDVIAICRRRIPQYPGDIHYALAVRLRANGDVDVLFPHANNWIPYTEAEIELGRIFFHARCDRFQGKYRVESKIKLSNPELMQFVSRVLTQKLEKPTIALIEAEGWRNERASDEKDKMWFQLKNEHLFEKRNILNFGHVSGHFCKYSREDEQLNHLLAVIRLRNRKETPQYITNRENWNTDSLTEDFTHLSGFLDKSVPQLLHYFSVGRLPETQKKQREKASKQLYMLDSNEKNEYGFNMAVKHQKMLELVPFFVRSDFKNEEYLKALCRVPHYLRVSPSWFMGNISKPLPMHLGNSLIDDCLCIVGLDS